MGVCQPLFQTFCPCELPCEGSPLCPCAPVDARRVPCRTETPSRRWADPAGTAIESEQSTDLNPSGGEHQPTVRPPSSCPCSSGAPLVPLRCSWRALSQAEPCHLVDQPGAANPKLGPHPPDRPLLLDVAGLQVAEKISEAKLGQPRRPPSLPTDRLDLASPLARGDLPGGPPGRPARRRTPARTPARRSAARRGGVAVVPAAAAWVAVRRPRWRVPG